MLLSSDGRLCRAAMTLAWLVTTSTLALGQTAPVDSASTTQAEANAGPSTSRILLKTATLQTAVGVTATAIYALGTGSLYSGAILAAVTMPAGLLTYPVNEYLWDFFSPPQWEAKDNTEFDATGSVVRNTWKYLTFKTGVATLKFGALYLYTGSGVATMTMGTISTLIFPVIYYANNIGWDWYDWYSASKMGQAGAQAP